MLGESWDATHGIGRGFQQFGLLGTEVPAADLILAILKDYLNLLDGGFTLAKVVGEGGVFGVSLIAAYLLCALRAAALLRSVARGVQTVEPLMVLTASSIVGYSIELFLRGAGYFTGTGLLLLASLLIWRARARGKGLTVSHAPNSSLVTVS